MEAAVLVVRLSSRAGACFNRPSLQRLSCSYFAGAPQLGSSLAEFESMNTNRTGSHKPPRRRPLVGRSFAADRQRQNGRSGNAHRTYERYLALAREATAHGDTIEAERLYQFAEHYFRVMREYG